MTHETAPCRAAIEGSEYEFCRLARPRTPRGARAGL